MARVVSFCLKFKDKKNKKKHIFFIAFTRNKFIAVNSCP
jgi:hypothetical protein